MVLRRPPQPHRVRDGQGHGQHDHLRLHPPEGRGPLSGGHLHDGDRRGVPRNAQRYGGAARSVRTADHLHPHRIPGIHHRHRSDGVHQLHAHRRNEDNHPVRAPVPRRPRDQPGNGAGQRNRGAGGLEPGPGNSQQAHQGQDLLRRDDHPSDGQRRRLHQHRMDRGGSGV